tara:strand:- start:205 stop:837 length:633 start_codon:yes stop_codon:yes gene_type:complete
LHPKTKGKLEQQALKEGVHIVGVDEVGRGCLAGPVYASSVILDLARLFSLEEGERKLIRDSKSLSQKQRQKAFAIVERIAVFIGLAHSTAEEIDQQGIVTATFNAMKRSLKSLNRPFAKIYVDGNKKIPGLSCPQESLVKGDSLSYSIAAASIVAKESRDSYMAKIASEFPVYGFDSHVGYGTKRHLLALANHGHCKLHRKTFEPIKSMV